MSAICLYVCPQVIEFEVTDEFRQNSLWLA